METTSVSQAWADEPFSAHASFHMIDVGEKLATRRRAEAQGEIVLSTAAYLALKDHKNPKGNVLALAEAAGIMAAKKTCDLIPLCHPLPLQAVYFKFQLNDESSSIKVFCEARTHAQTGVEMEAICGVNGALLTIYDLSKAVDPIIEIKSIRLNFKEGGKSGIWKHPNLSDDFISIKTSVASLSGVKTLIVTISDRVSKAEAQDKSGPFLVERLKSEGANIVAHICVSDDASVIQKNLLSAIETFSPQLILTTGGTGLSPRDVTPEALEAISSRKIAGFGELLRQDGSRHISTAWLSRSMACIIGDSLVIALPGSLNACREGFSVLQPILPHALHTLHGGNHDSI